MERFAPGLAAVREGGNTRFPPDFVLIDDKESVMAIEVELTLKERARLERILRGYVRNRNVDAIRHYASPR
jgi:hypothetical protein